MYLLAKLFILAFSVVEPEELPVIIHNNEKNSIRIYSGYFSRPFINILFIGDIKAEYHHTMIRGFDYRKIIKQNNGSPFITSLNLSIIRHLERGFQSNHNQYNLSAVWHFQSNLYNKPIRWFFAEGISFAERVPYVEGLHTRRLSNERDSKVMNYINVGFDFRLSDLTGNESLMNYRLGLSNSHRSGVFKKINLFNNTKGGSNYLNLFLEMDF
ncbi:MAG: hypothetical protein CMG08_07205 [Candidatus Marinimicrobia bacterium]|nr:hypothetical protein [Candidatus Neomarinimicrobiota bacterium]